MQRLATPADHERPSTSDVEQVALLPDGAATRDTAFLERQGNLFDEAEHREAAGYAQPEPNGPATSSGLSRCRGCRQRNRGW